MGGREKGRALFALASTATDAMCWFVKLWSSLELFGFEFLSCTKTDSRDKGLIGVSKNRVSQTKIVKCKDWVLCVAQVI